MSPTRKDIREMFEPDKDRITVRKLTLAIELRIGKPSRGETRFVRLTPQKARLLGCALIGLADDIDPADRTVVP